MRRIEICEAVGSVRDSIAIVDTTGITIITIYSTAFRGANI